MTAPYLAPYLAGLRLAGRRVVVVGGGAVAQRRLPGLLDGGADVLLVAPQVTPTVEGLVTAGRLAWERRPYATGDLDGAWYALALSDDPAVNAAVVAEADGARVFCVRADDAAHGSAVTPAVAVEGPVTIGVLGGGDPRRAAAVPRDRRRETRPPPSRGQTAHSCRAGAARVRNGRFPAALRPGPWPVSLTP